MENSIHANCMVSLMERGRLGEKLLNLTAAPGESVHIQGTQGRLDAWFSALCGLKKPEQGSVLLLGTDIYTLDARASAAFRRDHVGGVPQGGGLIPEMRLIDQIALPLKLAGVDSGEIVGRIRELTSELLPLHSLYSPPGRVSDRRQAHAAILRAVITRPEILILNGLLDGFEEIDACALWDALQALRPEGSALVYLSRDAAPEQLPWTQKLRI